MVAGLAFLSKKGFNPANLKNQKTVWEAQQQKEAEAKRIKEREDQLRRERDDEELARARGGDRGGDRAKLKFMYDVPPGGSNAHNNGRGENDLKPAAVSTSAAQEASDVASLLLAAERQPGDDDAAAAFREMLAAATTNQQQHTTTSSQETATTGLTHQFSDSNGAALSGTTVDKAISTQSSKKEHLSALEKAVGRRDASSSLTLEEQIARFPQLKNAPMAKGMSATNVNVTFKPLGTQLRNTRCFACGVWGHSKGDRECAMTGWDPFSMSNRRPSLASARPDEGVARQGSSDDRPVAEDDTKRRSYDDYGKKRTRDDYSSDSSSDSERRRRNRHRKKHKSRRHETKRKRRSERSSSPDERRRKKSSHKRRKKQSRHDDD